jgi:hypothetical protein
MAVRCNGLEPGLQSVSDSAEGRQSRYYSANKRGDSASICIIDEAAANEVNGRSGKEQTERSDGSAPLSQKRGKHT